MDLTLIQQCTFAPVMLLQQRIHEFAGRRVSGEGRVVAADELAQRYLSAVFNEEVSLYDEGIYSGRHSRVNASARDSRKGGALKYWALYHTEILCLCQRRKYGKE